MSERLIPCFLGGWGSTDELWQATLGAAALDRLAPDVRLLSWLDCLRDWPRAVAELAALPGQLLLVGWSLGALLSLRAALELAEMGLNEKLSALVLVSATPHLCAAEGYEGADPRMLAAMRARLRRSPDAVLEDFAAESAAPDGGEACVHAYLEQARSYKTDALSLGLQALAELDVRSQLGSLPVPCQLLHGSEDNIVPLGSVRFLAGCLPHARLQVLEGCGHALPFTHPSRIAQCIAGVVEEVTA